MRTVLVYVVGYGGRAVAVVSLIGVFVVLDGDESLKWLKVAGLVALVFLGWYMRGWAVALDKVLMAESAVKRRARKQAKDERGPR